MIELPPREDEEKQIKRKRVPLIIFLYLPLVLIVLALGFFMMQRSGMEKAVGRLEPAKTIYVWTATYLPPDTTTPDPCSQPLLTEEIENIKRLTRRFDEVSVLAQSTPKEQLAVVIMKMQEIRNSVEDQIIGQCMLPVRDAQLNYMGSVISTMTNFMAGVSSDILQKQIVVSRDLRVQFEIALAEKQGLKYYTPTPPPTFTPVPIMSSSTPAPIVVVAKEDIYILQGPSVGYPAIGTFLKDQKANAIGRLVNNDWLQIELAQSPGVFGWVPRQMIKLEGGVLSELPTAEPPPVK